MKNHFNLLAVIAVAVLFSANVVSAQTFHSQYLPQTNSNFLSLVNTTNPISYENWHIIIADANRVIINKMDFSFPCLEATNTWTYNLPISGTPPLGNIYLKDCFFVPDGSAIFCYGWEDTQMRGIMLRININTATGTVTGINFTNLNQPNSPITSACWANNTSGNSAYGNYCFGIIANNKAARVYVTTAGIFAINGTFEVFNNPPLSLYFPLYSISYDPAQNYFFASGTYKDRYVLLMKINNNSAFSQVSATPNHFVLDNNFLYDFEDGDVYSNVMTLTDNGELFIAQSIRTYNNLFLIWLIKYNYNNNIMSSTLYNTTSKCHLSNIAIYNNSNLYILGHHHPDKKFLFQIYTPSPANSNLYQMQYMTNAFVGSSGLYSTEMEYLSSISFSIMLNSINVSGAVNGEAFIVHAYDLNYDNCDNDLVVNTLIHFPQNFNSVIFQETPTFGTVPRFPTSAAYTMLPCSGLCWGSPRQLQELKSQIEERLQERNKTMQKPRPEIKVTEKQFVVNNFEGNCKFKIVDMLGRTMHQGNTQNGVVNYINISTSGIYIISVTDEKNNTQNSKTVISQ